MQLPRLALSEEAAPPTRNNQTLEVFDPQQAVWQRADTPLKPGAYRYTVHGRTEYIVACGPRIKGSKPGSVLV